ncbi:MAG: AMP-binding protein [Ignavibacteriales bacterium]|nr:AMP-binding protein [Ignavibacteriales bacterium]
MTLPHNASMLLATTAKFFGGEKSGTREVKLFTVPKIETLQEMLRHSSRRFGEKLALEDLTDTPISRVTYASLMKNVLKFGTALKKLGIPERAHIAVIGENRVQWGITYLSAMCFNYVIVPIDKNLSTNEILNIIHESDTVAIVFAESFETTFRERQSALKNLRYYIGMDLSSKKDGFYSMSQMIDESRGCTEMDMPTIDPDAPAVIIFTSGTLGRAKGVVLSQRNIASNLVAMTSMIIIRPDDRFLSVLPMHHTYECSCGFLCPLFTGASAHYARSLKTVVDDLQTVKATMLLGVPLLFDKMFKRIYKGIREKKLTAKIIGPLISVANVVERFGWKSFKKLVFKEIHSKFGGSIRLFIAGGAAPDPLVAKGLREFGFTFLQGYGLTETSPILALNQLDNFRDDAAGIPLPGIQIKINKPGDDGVGEVYAKGPNVMLGYYKNDAATQNAFDDGWFCTGDLGYIDSDGFLHISGRKKNVIISKSGKNVFPEEIEDALNRSPFILESLVFGEDDPKQDEVIAAQIVVDAEAFIELSESRSIPITDELLKKIIGEEVRKTNAELSGYKQIKRFYIRDHEFQKTTTQKIKRFLVQAPTETSQNEGQD